MSDRTYKLLWLHYFPGLTWEFVEYGPQGAPDGDGIPWDWWVTGCELIDKWLQRGV